MVSDPLDPTATSSIPFLTPMPLVLPQEGWHAHTPFVRAHAPALDERIRPEDVALAVDSINKALLSPPKPIPSGDVPFHLFKCVSLVHRR